MSREIKYSVEEEDEGVSVDFSAFYPVSQGHSINERSSLSVPLTSSEYSAYSAVSSMGSSSSSRSSFSTQDNEHKVIPPHIRAISSVGGLSSSASTSTYSRLDDSSSLGASIELPARRGRLPEMKYLGDEDRQESEDNGDNEDVFAALSRQFGNLETVINTNNRQVDAKHRNEQKLLQQEEDEYAAINESKNSSERAKLKCAHSCRLLGGKIGKEVEKRWPLLIAFALSGAVIYAIYKIVEYGRYLSSYGVPDGQTYQVYAAFNDRDNVFANQIYKELPTMIALSALGVLILNQLTGQIQLHFSRKRDKNILDQLLADGQITQSTVKAQSSVISALTNTVLELKHQVGELQEDKRELHNNMQMLINNFNHGSSSASSSQASQGTSQQGTQSRRHILPGSRELLSSGGMDDLATELERRRNNSPGGGDNEQKNSLSA